MLIDLSYIYNTLIFNNIKGFNNNSILYKRKERKLFLNIKYLNSNFLKNLNFSFIYILNTYLRFFSLKTYIKLFFINNALVKSFIKSSKNIFYSKNNLFNFNKEFLYINNINNLKKKNLYNIKLNKLLIYKTVFNFKILVESNFKKKNKKFKKINYKRINKSIVYIIIKSIFSKNKNKNLFLDFNKGL
jgi:hypothetical protein